MFPVFGNFSLPDRNRFGLRIDRCVLLQEKFGFFEFRCLEYMIYIKGRFVLNCVYILDEMGVGIYLFVICRENTNTFIGMVKVA